ncbi:unnamed protein product [Mytilus edulis]|uniref:Ankyrin repeat protein n=1 Tax=Mytilus edulis TaxID=6550 RepID=A0A8S3U610_MYTED|nr:unnamed protein product [Mytilus edulis]
MSVVLFQVLGETALMRAAGEDTWRSVVSSLIEDDRGGLTALMFAAIGGHLEICRLLIDRGFYQTSFDVSCIIPEGGLTALLSAAQWGHLEICRLLIDRGCKIDITTGYGETALMFAARKDTWRSVVSSLIEDNNGYTALHYAAQGTSTDHKISSRKRCQSIGYNT